MSAVCEIKMDFVALAEQYAGQWVALHPETGDVLASGGSPGEVLAAASTAGVADAIVTMVVDDYGAYVTWLK